MNNPSVEAAVEAAVATIRAIAAGVTSSPPPSPGWNELSATGCNGPSWRRGTMPVFGPMGTERNTDAQALARAGSQ